MLKTPKIDLRIPLRIFQLLPEEKRRLGLIVFIVGLIHLLLFFTIEIQYPTANEAATRRTEIFLSSSSLMGAESWTSTVFWNQMRDPSTVLHQSLISPEKLKLLQPVFEKISDSNLPLLPVGSEFNSQEEKLLPLENKAFEKMILSPNKFIFSTSATTPNPPSQILYSKNLEERAIKTPLVWPKASVNLLNESRVTTIRLGISPEGFVIHALVEESSGSNSVDQIALQEIRKTTFQVKAGSTLEWGSITVFWAFTNPAPQTKEGA